MIKKLLTSAVITMSFVAVNAQEPCAPAYDKTPLKNNFTVAATIGYNNYTNTRAGSFGVSAASSNWNQSNLMLGLDLGWFMTENWKLSMGGGFNFSNNPGFVGITGTEGSPTTGGIATYGPVAEQSNFNFMINLGVDRYFKVKNITNLMWYTGIRAMYAYGQDRFKAVNDRVNNNGRAVADTWNLGGALEFGAEYYLTKSVFVGAQFDLASYRYTKTTSVPEPGLASRAADANSVGIFSAPMAKVGFRFGNSRPAPKRAEIEKTVTVKEYVHDTVYVEVPVEKQPAIEDLPSASVFFSIAKSDISPEEDATIRQLIKDVNGRSVYYLVVGYADKGTGNPTINKKYAADRAARVAKALNEKYGVPESDIKTDSKGDTVQPFAQNDKNRVAIITVEKK